MLTRQGSKVTLLASLDVFNTVCAEFNWYMAWILSFAISDHTTYTTLVSNLKSLLSISNGSKIKADCKNPKLLPSTILIFEFLPYLTMRTGPIRHFVIVYVNDNFEVSGVSVSNGSKDMTNLIQILVEWSPNFI